MADINASDSRAAPQMSGRQLAEVDRITINAPIGPIDPGKVVMSYDGDMDTMMVYLSGRGRPAISVFLDESTYALVEPTTHRLLGFQMEDFASHLVREHPEFIEALEFAELRDMTADDVRALRQEVLGYRGRFMSWLRRELWRIKRQSRRMIVAERLIASENNRIAGCAFA